VGLTGAHDGPRDSTTALPEERPSIAPLAVAGLGALVLAGSLAAFGPHGVAVGAVVFAVAVTLAVVDTRTSLVRWPVALVTLVGVVWLIPIKLYRFPIEVGFAIEPYRVVVGVLACALVVWAVRNREAISFGGLERPLVLLLGVTLIAQVVNFRALNAAEPGTALKSLSYFLSFILVFVVVASVVRTLDHAETVIKALVVGGVVVAVFAAYEARSNYNVFSHLHEWFPALDRDAREQSSLRGGRERVRASAQHPIALAAALMMMLPFAFYLASRAKSMAGSILWGAAAIAMALGALTTISRTAVLMGIAMGVTALVLRPQAVLRLWPLLIVLPVATHAVAPGVLGGLYNSLFPRRGITSQLSGREGLPGSGRFDDVDPALKLWEQSPIVGHGIGTTVTPPLDPGDFRPSVELIFDNQYLLTFVQIGTVGLVALVWFLVAAAAATGKGARGPGGAASDLMAACCVSIVGFAAGMLAYDAFAFVQATLVFFIIAAVGLAVRRATATPRLTVPA
jgi:hypothetical protein